MDIGNTVFTLGVEVEDIVNYLTNEHLEKLKVETETRKVLKEAKVETSGRGNTISFSLSDSLRALVKLFVKKIKKEYESDVEHAIQELLSGYLDRKLEPHYDQNKCEFNPYSLEVQSTRFGGYLTSYAMYEDGTGFDLTEPLPDSKPERFPIVVQMISYNYDMHDEYALAKLKEDTDFKRTLNALVGDNIKALFQFECQSYS